MSMIITLVDKELHSPKPNHDFAETNLRSRILHLVNKLPDITGKVYTVNDRRQEIFHLELCATV